MDNLAISVENISKTYKLYGKPVDRLKESLHVLKKKYHTDYFALKDVSFQIGRGEIFGIIGLNGAGKSTLLKIITGVLTQSEGSVVRNGRIAALLELGAGFNPEYTGLENIYLNGTMMGYSKEEVDNKLESVLEFADIGEFIYQPVKTYSSGMFARLAFSVSINIDPEILIVDEALSVGDVFFQAKCYKKFEEFKNGGKTILFVSHDLGSIIKYCDRAILLNKGMVYKIGTASEIVDEYKKIMVQGNSVSDLGGKDSNYAAYSKDNRYKDSLIINDKFIEYGNGKAEIIDYAILNDEDVVTNKILKDKVFKIRIVVQFNDNVKEPIFAFTIKDVKGTEIAGTNTMIESIDTKVLEKGSIIEAEFAQKMILQGGCYLISLGCTGYIGDDFVVYHRLYDITNLEVISSKNTVGYFDMNSQISLDKLN